MDSRYPMKKSTLFVISGVALLLLLSKKTRAITPTQSSSQIGQMVVSSVLNDSTSPEVKANTSTFGLFNQWASMIELKYPTASESLPRLGNIDYDANHLMVDGYDLDMQQQQDIANASLGGSYPRVIDGITITYPGMLDRLQIDLTNAVQKSGYNEFRDIPQ